MGKIFCLMGKSSSGKDTIYKRLIADEELDLRRIVPYTTRPIRVNEVDGVEYFFVDEAKLDQLTAENKVVEVRSYDTVLGVWKYFTVDDGQVDLEKGNYLVIGTLEAYEKMRHYFGKDQVLPIYIEIDDGIRLQRALDRERSEEFPKYAEMCRRFLADEEDFSEENLKNAEVTLRFLNDHLQDTVEKVKSYCLENM